VHVEKEFRRNKSSAGTTQRSPVSLSARLARTATPGRAASTHPYDVSECTGHSSKPLESRRFPVVSRIRPPRSCGGDRHRAGAVNEPGGVCALVDSLTDPPPRLDRSDVCGVDPGASARARPPHALEPEGDTPRATSPLAQRPPGRSPSWSSTRRFRENVADKISLVFSPHPASSLNS
jgi:hypothetical protein